VRRVAFSLIELIANPRFYDGTEVAVTGYLVLDKTHEDEDDGTLYLERESARVNITTNAVSIRFGACRDRLPPLNDELLSPEPGNLPPLPGYVTLRGTFRPAGDDEALSQGTICAITFLNGQEDPEQGTGKDSWWNTVARPVRSSAPATKRPPR
jgi:hypothetical protein